MDLTKHCENFANYFLEEQNQSVICEDYGFITYHLNGAECCIWNIYIRPEFRKKGLAVELLNIVENLARSKDCKVLTGYTMLGKKNDNARFTRKIKLMAQSGFLVKEMTDRDICWIKPLEV